MGGERPVVTSGKRDGIAFAGEESNNEIIEGKSNGVMTVRFGFGARSAVTAPLQCKQGTRKGKGDGWRPAAQHWQHPAALWPAMEKLPLPHMHVVVAQFTAISISNPKIA